MKKRYAKHPKAAVIEDVDGKPGKKTIEELLWGDLLDLQDEVSGDFVRVKVRPHKGGPRITGWMKKTDFTKKPLLEVTFVDIGQGDGCVVVTPDQRVIVIDAGEDDNMSRYLHWRLGYPSANRPTRVHAAVISHPDQDHYRGFRDIFQADWATFNTVYQNGLVERKATPMLGPRTEGKLKIYTDLIDSTKKLRRVLEDDAAADSGKVYPGMLRQALTDGKFGNFRMLSRDDGFMPGFEDGEKISIQVLGPVTEKDADGKVIGLRRLGAPGVTKNGHSVVLRLTFGNTRVLLGGDLNIPSEKLLLESWVGREMPKKPKKSAPPEEHAKFAEEKRKFIRDARKLIEVDVAKSCHHGSADFSSLFLEAVHPVATVISSGDDEPHSHPRAETLGAIGLASRGERPLIYSTELARSAVDRIKDPREEQAAIKRLHKQVLAEKDKAKRKKLAKKFRDLVDETVKRSVQMYGAIYLRTDGTRAVIGQRFETRGSGGTWDLCHLEPDPDGKLEYHSKHAKH